MAKLTFQLRTDFITLSQLLKAVDLVGSGGEGKDWIAQGGFKVNGEPEDRRGRKIRVGDRVQLPDGTIIEVR